MNSISLADISDAQADLKEVLVETPTLRLNSDRWKGILPDIAGGAIKMELFQQAGSFKARGAYLGIHRLTDNERSKGVVAASGGNHALAVAWAARKAGVSARIAIPKAVDPVRLDGCRTMGAEVILCDDIADAFATMETCAADEGRTIMHPFEGIFDGFIVFHPNRWDHCIRSSENAGLGREIHHFFDVRTLGDKFFGENMEEKIVGEGLQA